MRRPLPVPSPASPPPSSSSSPPVSFESIPPAGPSELIAWPTRPLTPPASSSIGLTVSSSSSGPFFTAYLAAPVAAFFATGASTASAASDATFLSSANTPPPEPPSSVDCSSSSPSSSSNSSRSRTSSSSSRSRRLRSFAVVRVIVTLLPQVSSNGAAVPVLNHPKTGDLQGFLERNQGSETPPVSSGSCGRAPPRGGSFRPRFPQASPGQRVGVRDRPTRGQSCLTTVGASGLDQPRGPCPLPPEARPEALPEGDEAPDPLRGLGLGNPHEPYPFLERK